MRLTVLNRFSPDPHRAPATMTEDQREHPVVKLIRRRRDEGSKPGARADGRRVALVIEGGGMRGVVSAGMTAAIEQLGLRDAFDEVHGASAGAFNGAFLLAGQAAYLTALYPHGFGDPSFVNFRDTLLRRRPIFDMDYVIGEVWRHQRPLRTDEILASGIELHCTATDVESTPDRRPHRAARRRRDPLRDARLGPAAVAGGPAGRIPRPSLAGRDAGRGDPGARRPDHGHRHAGAPDPPSWRRSTRRCPARWPGSPTATWPEAEPGAGGPSRVPLSAL